VSPLLVAPCPVISMMDGPLSCGRAMGYTRFVTYTLPQEGGSSLKASGWTLVNTKAGGTEAMWNSRPRLNRPRVDTTPFQMKFQWESK
jgi:hypothetical protein